MPYGRRYRTRNTSYRKRSQGKSKAAYRARRRRAYRRRRRVQRVRWEMPIRQCKYVKFTYADDNFSSNTGVTYMSSHFFRGNSCFDPDYTGVGVQPYGWDQWTALYGTYRVAASSIKINFYTEEPCRLLKAYLFPFAASSVDYDDPSDLRQIPRCKCVTFGDGTGPSRHNKIWHYATTKMVNPDFSSTDNDYQSLTTANPAATWYWILYFDSTAIGEAVAVTFDVEITYYTVLKKYNSTNES